MNVAVMGVDPGVNGGIVVLNATGSPSYIAKLNSGMSEDDVVEAVRLGVYALAKSGGHECFFEKVHHISGDGGQGSHTFGYIKGLLRGGIKMLGVKIYDVPPQLWQAKLDCLTGGDKNVSKRRAIEIFPDVKVTHACADALLIALYGRLCAR